MNHSYSLLRTHAAVWGFPCFPAARCRCPYRTVALSPRFLSSRFLNFVVVFSYKVVLDPQSIEDWRLPPQ